MAADQTADPAAGLFCPVPLRRYPHVLLAHGGGGSLMRDLLEELVLPTFANPVLNARHDGAVLDVDGVRLAFTTDSYVVKPLFFPGGDIGSLAVNGTVNDLAMCGARARWLSAGLILEEGLPMETLARVVSSMRAAADLAEVELVTGDTKVVDRGKGDGVFVSTAGLGVLARDRVVAPGRVRPGDVVLLSGDIGRHGIAIMAAREGLAFDTTVESDCAPLVRPALALFDRGLDVHCLRDLTRGGLATALVEIARDSGLHVRIDERAIPVREDVRGACEILGFDPLYIANEGRFVAFAAPGDADAALAALCDDPLTAGATIIGSVSDAPARLVTMKSLIGATRVVDMLSGEQLPRIC